MSQKFLPACGLPLIFTATLLANNGVDSGPFNSHSSETSRPSRQTVDWDARGSADGFEISEPTGEVTLQHALALALLENPKLRSYSLEVRAAEARVLQAGLLPNPEIELGIGEFGGSGSRSGLKSTETTLQFSQLIELGRKRAKRRRVAIFEGELAGWDYESARLDVLAETTMAFIDLLAAQRRSELSLNTLKLAKEFHLVVTERVQAGKVSPLEERRARVALALSEIQSERAKRELNAFRSKLSAMWGKESANFREAMGKLEPLLPPPVSNLEDWPIHNPDLDRWETEIELREAAHRLEKSRRIPDLTVGAGIQSFNETDETSAVVAASIPIPLFDRNQGAIRAAELELSKAAEERRAAELQIRSALNESFQELSSAYVEAKLLLEEVAPAARFAMEAARSGYEQGKYGYIEVLDAQRSFFETEFQLIDSLLNYHRSVAELERLLGRPLNHGTQY